MKKITKIMVFLLSFVVTATAVPLQTLAASKKITAINLEIENNLEVGGEYSTDDIEITTKKANYYVGEVEILNEGGRWKSTDTPKITVTLNAEDGYYFSVVKDNVKIKGGTYVSGKKVDSYTLVLTITLESMQERVGEVKDVWWTSQTGAGWFEAENAGYYEVRLYRNDKAVGELQKVTDTKIDFGNLMRKEGTYGFRVRAVNMKNESTKSEWQQAEETSYIDNETAERLRAQYNNDIPSNMTEPGQSVPKEYSQYGWIHDNGGWWYRNEDSSYTVNNWQMIDGKWYYFDSRGYMVTGWIDWQGKSYYCDPVNGDMQVDKVIPDGSGRRVDSAGVWIE